MPWQEYLDETERAELARSKSARDAAAFAYRKLRLRLKTRADNRARSMAKKAEKDKNGA